MTRPTQSKTQTNPAAPLLRTIALTLAALAIGLAIHFRDGEYMFGSASAFYPPIWFIGLALLALAVAVRPPLWIRVSERFRVEEVALAGLMAAVLVQFAVMIKSPPVGWNVWSDDLIDSTRDNLRLYYGGLTLAAGLTIGLLAFRRRLWLVPFLAIVGLHVYLGIWTVRSCPEPFIDVWYFQQIGAKALLHGENPYAVRYPNIYANQKAEQDRQQAESDAADRADAEAQQTTATAPSTMPATAPADRREVYGRSLVDGEHLNFGFPYPPESLYLSTLGYALAGDPRYAQVVAFSLAGLLLAFARPKAHAVSGRSSFLPGSRAEIAVSSSEDQSTNEQREVDVKPATKAAPPDDARWSALAALLLLFTPRAFFIIGRGWTEPFVVVLLMLTLFVAARLPKLLPIALGLFLASKQYLVFAVPLAWLLVPGPRDWPRAIKLITGALLVAAVVTLPLALQDYHAFFNSTFTAQAQAPFRTDALSWLVWFYERTGLQLGSWVAFAIAGVSLIACLRWCARTPAGFSLGLAAVYLPFIAFNKQAFANYYLFVIASIVGAIAVGSASADAKAR